MELGNVEKIGYELGLPRKELWATTPRELGVMSQVRFREKINEAKNRRWETALICQSIRAYSFGAKKGGLSVAEVYRGMAVKDPEEEESGETRRIYKGSLSEQFKAHAKWVEEQQSNGDRI